MRSESRGDLAQEVGDVVEQDEDDEGSDNSIRDVV